MTVLDTLLLSAITALAGVIGVLWRALLSARSVADQDRRTASRLIFALLGARAEHMGEKPPATVSTPEAPKFAEATKIAVEALNGDLEQMVRNYLATDPPPPKTGEDK